MHIHRLSLGVILLAACAGPEPPPVLDPAASASLDSVLRGAVAEGKVPGIVGLVTGRDSVLYLRAFGVMDAAGEEPMREDALFNIASMTKPITSLGIMMLVEEGSIGLDDPAAGYLPDLSNREVLVSIEPSVVTRAASRTLTVRDLLSHTAGFGYMFSNPELLSWTRATGRSALDQPLLHDPGARWTYGSNTLFIGRIIEEVSGQPLDRFLEARIFTPLGMDNTSFETPADAVQRRVASYSTWGRAAHRQPQG